MTVRRPVFAFLALAIGAVQSVSAQGNFSASEIVLNEWPGELYFVDMDGDERQDLVIPQWSVNAGRELAIYLQQSNGRFAAQPSRLVEIKSEIIAIAFADLRPEPGHELLLFSADTVFSLSSAIASYSGNLKPLFAWDLIAAVPNRRRVHVLPPLVDINKDGYVDLLLPGQEGYGLFYGAAEEQFSLAFRFNTVNEELSPSELPLGNARLDTTLTINERDGIIMSVRARGNSAFEDFLSDWQQNDGDELLSSRRWRPSASLRPMSDGERQDIVFMNIGNDLYGQVNILLQDESGGFASQVDWQGPIDTRGDIRIMDVNGDNRADVLRIIDNSNEWNVQFFLNKGASFDFSTPDQVMRFSGYDLNVSLVRLDDSRAPQLSVSYYTIPVINAVRNASIVRTQLLFQSAGGGQLFNTRPDFRLDQNFSADTVRGLSAQIDMHSDVNGDGRKDAVYVTEEGTLAAKTIDNTLRFADRPFWQYVPTRSIMDFGSLDMNGDGIPDFYLKHSSALTILVSTP